MTNTNKNKCFIIMPISTPKEREERYNDGKYHFDHVLKHLFIPSLKVAGFEPIPPKSTGSEVIQAEIIGNLASCKLVLCDMSILNPNVFFEFGIRTALNKPVALVVDDTTIEIPFDAGIINFHRYKNVLHPSTLEKEKVDLAKHIKEAYKKTKKNNALWKHFGVAQAGNFKPEEVEIGEKIDLLTKEVRSLIQIAGKEDKEIQAKIEGIKRDMIWEAWTRDQGTAYGLRNEMAINALMEESPKASNFRKEMVKALVDYQQKSSIPSKK